MALVQTGRRLYNITLLRRIVSDLTYNTNEANQ